MTLLKKIVCSMTAFSLLTLASHNTVKSAEVIPAPEPLSDNYSLQYSYNPYPEGSRPVPPSVRTNERTFSKRTINIEKETHIHYHNHPPVIAATPHMHVEIGIISPPIIFRTFPRPAPVFTPLPPIHQPGPLFPPSPPAFRGPYHIRRP